MNTPKVLVIGLGVSGRAAADLLLKRGVRLWGVDDRGPSVLPTGVELYEKEQPIDYAVLSPGISPEHPLLKELQAQSIPVIGEAELAFQYFQGQKVLAITGTNGKTTTTLLLEHILKYAGLPAHAVGNVGRALCHYLCESPKPDDILVTELSSYQLDTLSSPLINTGLILNISEDHLDRYSTMEAYVRSKFRLFSCLQPERLCYVHEEVAEKYSSHLSPPHKLSLRTFGRSPKSFLYHDGKQVFINKKVAFKWPAGYRDKYGPDVDNALGAFALCQELGVAVSSFLDALQSFKKPPHRLEFVEEVRGISYYNDSKGTNIEAVIKAVEALKGPVVLIVGGRDKGASYAPWISALSGKVQRMIALGEAAPKIIKEMGTHFPIDKASGFDEAVHTAARYAQPGDQVLLSPGCSSLDMFPHFEARGERFKALVHALARENTL